MLCLLLLITEFLQFSLEMLNLASHFDLVNLTIQLILVIYSSERSRSTTAYIIVSSCFVIASRGSYLRLPLLNCWLLMFSHLFNQLGNYLENVRQYFDIPKCDKTSLIQTNRLERRTYILLLGFHNFVHYLIRKLIIL
jgi:hypothetical protein